MNANELADELESCRDYELPEFVHKTAVMLRQQQSEIAELKHMNRNWQISENILLLELEKLQHRELTDEPMRKYVEDFATRCGWIRGGEGAFEYIQRKSYAQGIEDASKKELTDEILWELAEKHLDTDNTWGESNVTGIGDFIEAILRKAQEK